MFAATLSTSVVATAAVVATGFATVAVPIGLGDAVVDFAVNLAIVTVTFAVAEEVGFRGYLLPRLSAFTRIRSPAVSGLVHAAWHLPLIFLTPLYQSDGTMPIVLVVFVGTVVAAGFFRGDLRLATGSVTLRCVRGVGRVAVAGHIRLGIGLVASARAGWLLWRARRGRGRGRRPPRFRVWRAVTVVIPAPACTRWGPPLGPRVRTRGQPCATSGARPVVTGPSVRDPPLYRP